ncbi:Na+/H+ antiporter subunit E [Schlegelella aquatica]|uniref:Na+/H+ antiporter subunit E n=1 Tax=Caldimonas aquatica TaxID=376175 RepID=UPI0037516AD9
MTSRHTPPPAERRWLAHPSLSVLLAAVWLLLQQSVHVSQLLAAALFGLVVPGLVHRFLGPSVRVRRLDRALQFGALVLWDIVVSNVVVARLVLSPGSNPHPAWVRVPLRLQHPAAMTLLASVITMTPGTVSCVVDEHRREILVHALDCLDAEALARQIADRYERLLLEIFE